MGGFKVEGIKDPEENAFDRQERIKWWDQGKIEKANIMVVGAGAIGNETLKNIALLGARKIFIVDFDIISISNLSRTVLFNKSDVGKKKAEVASQRVKKLCLASDPKIDWFHGDIVWELGTGVFRKMDIVLGCLDNIETRFAINKQCWLANVPWIDSGINELGVHVSFFQSQTPPCYACGTSTEQKEATRQRYSCDDFMKSMITQGKIPTTQVASSIASAIQVQEAIKYLCGQEVKSGRKIYYQGANNDFDVIKIITDPNCQYHVTYENIVDLSISSSIKLKDFLFLVSQKRYSGDYAMVDLNADRFFVTWVTCHSCGKRIELYKPSHKIFDIDAFCTKCKEQNLLKDKLNTSVRAEKEFVSEFSLEQSENRLLEMSLRELGIPLWHVIPVRDKNGNYQYYEISGDKHEVIPNIISKVDKEIHIE